MTFTVGSLFSGIGGIDLAFERAGARVLWNNEIDAPCRKVLAHHWPGVPRFKDVRTVTGVGLRSSGLAVDAVVGGFPCQDVSVAGARAGLAGERSGLFYEFARVLDEARPAWCVVENVPGLLSSHAGGDMGTVIGHLVDLGYGVAWRVLDAQYFGVAQRRRRVFIVGCLGDRGRAAEVLLVGEGGGGDPPARRTEGQDVAGTLGGGSGSRGWCDDLDRATFIPAVSHALVAPSTGGAHLDHNSETLLPTLALTERSRNGAKTVEWQEEQSYALLNPGAGGRSDGHMVMTPQLAVRRLTPLECLRLQGLPDDWLDGLKLADSIKYRMIGNAVAVPVVEWLARRMLAVSGRAVS